ncbi:hypothetical protein [uncultured Roseobacter sp.]|uniref:hypothetical protein n=1 Tax=uncultured Roseobacter sp. TaxID=114847 RepID=UPI00261F7F2E|nr:hypothetical protein [uncultured Roseobacter sp.]
MNKNFIGRLGETPEQEDRDLFRTYGGPIRVEIVPGFHRSGKYLFLARAFFQQDKEIVTLFSGRRALDTGPLAQTLQALESLAAQRAAAERRPAPPKDAIRLPVQIKGAWQHQYYADDDGEEVKIFQLVVARWGFTDLQGQSHQFGESPACDVKSSRRVKSRMLQPREIDALPRERHPRPAEG